MKAGAAADEKKDDDDSDFDDWQGVSRESDQSDQE